MQQTVPVFQRGLKAWKRAYYFLFKHLHELFSKIPFIIWAVKNYSKWFFSRWMKFWLCNTDKWMLKTYFLWDLYWLGWMQDQTFSALTAHLWWHCLQMQQKLHGALEISLFIKNIKREERTVFSVGENLQHSSSCNTDKKPMTHQQCGSHG